MSRRRPATALLPACVLVAAGVLVALSGCTAVATPTAVPAPMRESRFWSVIDAARNSTDPTAPSARPAALRAQLAGLSTHDVAAFDVRFYTELEMLDRWTLWDAGSAAADGMGTTPSSTSAPG